MHQQVDLRAEALHLSRFRENFEATGKAWGRGGAVVRFPRVIGAGRGWLIEELVSDSSIPIGALYDIEGWEGGVNRIKFTNCILSCICICDCT